MGSGQTTIDVASDVVLPSDPRPRGCGVLQPEYAALVVVLRCGLDSVLRLNWRASRKSPHPRGLFVVLVPLSNRYLRVVASTMFFG